MTLQPLPVKVPCYLLMGFLLSQLFPLGHATDQSRVADDPREIIRRAVENDFANDKKARDYLYVEREEDRNLDSQGNVKSTASTTHEIMVLYGRQVERLVARDDKPLSTKEAAKEEARIQKLMDKWSKETPKEREKRLAQDEKDREETRSFVREVTAAYDFQMEDTEQLNGRDVYVIDARPRPDFHPQTRYGKFLPNFRFRVWIDRADCQWVKLDMDTIKTASWGLFLARLHAGSHLEMEQTRVNDEIWLPLRQQFRFDARLALLKHYNLEMVTTYKDYRKFRTEVRILSSGPPP